MTEAISNKQCTKPYRIVTCRQLRDKITQFVESRWSTSGRVLIRSSAYVTCETYSCNFHEPRAACSGPD